MINLSKDLGKAKSIGISAHIRPDGDAIGSSMGLYLYLKKTRPDADVHVFLEAIPEGFESIKDIDAIEDANAYNGKLDVFFALDCAADRLGASERLFREASLTVNVDHHKTNPGCGSYNYIDANASSASELVYDLLDKEMLDADIAKAIYLGIIHDSGVMQYSCTSPKTLRIVADLISFGFDFPALIKSSFYDKTYVQMQIQGRALLESFLIMDGRMAVSQVDRKMIEFYGATSKDFDGIVNQLTHIKGVDVAVFMWQTENMDYKVSLRSNENVDVSKVAAFFNGGGHARAAGCTMQGNFRDVVNNITSQVELQYKGANA